MSKFIQMRYVLVAAYLDYVNNYLTVEKYAEHHGLRVDEARRLLELATEVASTHDPDE
jgi:hypothetical protein